MQNVRTLLTQNVITFFTSKGAWSTRVGTLHLVHRLRVVPHFSSGIVGRAKREHAWKSPHERKGDTRRGERKMRDYRQSPSFWPFTADWFRSVKFVSRSKSIKRIQWDSFSHWAVIALVIGKVQGIFIASERKPRHKFSSRLHFLSPRRVSPFLAWVDFTRARVSLALLSLRKIVGTTRSLSCSKYGFWLWSWDLGKPNGNPTGLDVTMGWLDSLLFANCEGVFLIEVEATPNSHYAHKHFFYRCISSHPQRKRYGKIS